MNKKSLVVLTVLVLLAAFAGGSYFYNAQKTQEMKFLADKNFSLFVRDHSPRMGDEKAQIYLIEFLDPECEACRAIYPYVKEIMRAYAGKVQLVVRYAPFHGNSKFAVQILEAARKQGKYWEALHLFFERQPEWGDHHNPQPELLWEFLPSIGVDIAKIKKDMNDPAIAKIIDQDIQDLQVLGVQRTPTFFVNGRPLMKFGPQHLRDLIDLVLSEI